MARFTRILVPTDFSPASEAALAAATELADRFGASIHLLHVLEDPYSTSAYATEVYGFLPPGLRETWQENAEKRLQALMPRDQGTRSGGSYAVVFGAPARAIVDHAHGAGIDLIVMGTHGRSGVAHLLLGSVAERVVRTAACPVMTVRGVAGHDAATAREAAAGVGAGR
jgi:nucleotide-binding universal stress UspA family protein